MSKHYCTVCNARSAHCFVAARLAALTCMSKRWCTVVRFEVNLSDFCRYYQQPTNNTPELAFQIGSMQQLSYSGCQCSDIAAVCCDSRIVCWQEILSPSDIRWNARRAIGTGFSPWNSPQGSTRPFIVCWQDRIVPHNISVLYPPAGLSAVIRVSVCDDNAMRVR